MRRGQLTILLIIAVLIGISALFAWYLLDLATPDAKPGNIQPGETKTETRLCLEQAGTQAIMNALTHGGVNENYWGERGNIAVQDMGSKTRLAYTEGTTTGETGEGATRGLEQSNDPWSQQEYVLDGNSPVRIWIFRGPDVINYWPNGTELTAQSTNDPATGPYVGQLNTEPLCSRRGFNRPGASLDGSNSCLAGTYRIRTGVELSWQEALEQRITAMVIDDELCDLPEPVTVALGEQDVTLISGNESVTIDIALKRMYNLAYTLAKHEMANYTFDPARIDGSVVGAPTKIAITGCDDSQFGQDCAIPGLVVTTKQVADLFEQFDEDENRIQYPWNGYLASSVFEPYDDAWRQSATIVSITDTNVIIDNQNPTLYFAIKNRYPLATGVQTDATTSNLVFTAADSDGTPVYVSCYESTGSAIVPECTGSTDKLSTESWTFSKNTYCTNGSAAVDLRVNYILCSENTRPVMGARRVPSDWTSLIPTGNTDPAAGPLGAIDLLPRNCRLAITNVTVSCP